MIGAFLTTIINAVKSWFYNRYEVSAPSFVRLYLYELASSHCNNNFCQPAGASQKIDFSCTPDIVAYVPHVRHYPFPLLAANVDDLDEVSHCFSLSFLFLFVLLILYHFIAIAASGIYRH